MPRNSRPRKKYVPKPDDSILMRFSEEDERQFQLAPHVQLTSLMHGNGDSYAWDTLELRLKWARNLAEKKALPEVVAELDKGFSSLLEVHNRYSLIARYGVSGAEATSLGDSLNLADELQVASTKRELRDSLNLTLASLRRNPSLDRKNCFAS